MREDVYVPNTTFVLEDVRICIVTLLCHNTLNPKPCNLEDYPHNCTIVNIYHLLVYRSAKQLHIPIWAGAWKLHLWITETSPKLTHIGVC